MASSNFSWMPAPGRHEVSVGSSLGRALKARKGTTATTKRSNLPEREFYSFRYNFKPESVDAARPGTIEVLKNADVNNVTVEHSSSQAGGSHIFKGKQQPAKEWECVLIYDEELGTFSLEKLDSFINLNYDGRSTIGLNHADPTSSNEPSTSKITVPDIEVGEVIEKELGVEDAEGELDEDYVAPSIALRREEEEDDDEEDVPIAATRPPPQMPPSLPKQQSKPAKAPPPARSKAVKQNTTKNKRDRNDAPQETSIAEVEDLQFGQPARQGKRPRPSPPAEGLALPGTMSSVSDPLAHLPSTKPAPAHPAPVPSDSEEDWDEVPAEVPPAPEALEINLSGADGEDEEEIDLNAFEAEMNEHLEASDDDFLAAAVMSEPETPATGTAGKPMSLNQYAGGVPSPDDDDYSSSASDDSEED